MYKTRKSKKSFRYQLNQTTFFIVLVMGFLASMTIISDPIRSESVVLSRAPASVQSTEMPAPEAIKITNVLSLDCKAGSQTVRSGQVRLRGQICGDAASIASSQIENKRNGYIATVFHQDRGFTTDFIQLSEGENTVTVKHTFSDGTSEELTYSITRQ